MADRERAAQWRAQTTEPNSFSRRRLLGTTTLAVAGAFMVTEASGQQPQSVWPPREGVISRGLFFGSPRPYGMWHENAISHPPREVELG